MAKFFQSGKGRQRALTALSVMLVGSLSLGVFSACTTTGDDDDDDTVASKSDTQLIKNGDFEFYSDNNQTELDKKRSLITRSPDSWSLSTASGAPASETGSGVINTAEWDYLTKEGRKFTSVADAYAHWKDENVTAYDRLKFYEDFDDEIDDLKSDSAEAKLFADYKYSVDFEDVEYLSEISNPGTHGETSGTSVLMIHNRKTTDSVVGTAQYYTSSTTITLSAGTAAELSLWVKTDDLKHWKDLPVESVGGAYVEVEHSVGGTTQSAMKLENINTKDAAENNGWVKYNLYVRASTFATSTFKIKFGLGGGSKDDMYYAVNGYAFFDDLTCKIISSDDYEEATKDLTADYKCDVTSEAKDKLFNTADGALTGDTFALDLYDGEGFDEFALDDAQHEFTAPALTEEKYGNQTYTTANYQNLNLGVSDKSYTNYATLAEMKGAGNPLLTSVLDKDFGEKFPFASEKVLMLMSANGAPYTAKVASASFAVAPKEHLLVSFYVKTSEMEGFTGAGVTLVDGVNKTTISSVDTTVLATTDIDDDNKDIYDGWQRCFFFVSNDTETDKQFSLEFTYGSTTVVGTNAENYTDGYAAFTGFRTRALTKTEYGYASTGDLAKKVSLSGEIDSNSKFDDAAETSSAIENAPAKAMAYEGVRGGDKLVGGEGDDKTDNPPENITAGLVNYKYADAYKTADWAQAISADTENWWQSAFGSARQPLVIVNNSATEKTAYGFVAKSTTSIASSSTQKISMRVKVSEGSKAYIYLIDTSDVKKGYYNGLTLNTPAVTYWYDDEGNICAKDPSDKDYNKKTDIAYFLQENGLYKSSDKNDANYYANLANYETDKDSNLLTADEKTAFYFNKDDGAYYAYYDEDKDVYSTPVKDLDRKYARYASAEEKPQSVIVVEGTAENAGKWINVSFYVKTGDEAKSYRLEVWSGSRDGKVTNPAGYVVFDNYSSADASSDYSDLLAERVQAVKDANGIGKDDNLTENAQYYAYTFFDDPSYLRYDETTDEDNTGNPYGSYKQSNYSEQLVYFYNVDGDAGADNVIYRIFLDYSATDVTVSRDVTNDGDDDTTDNDTATTPQYNVWLLIASGALAVVLVFVIISVIVRKILKKRGGARGKTVSRKQKREKKRKESPAPEEAPKKEEPKDEFDPYNE